ncbi:MAG: dTMP kinase [Alphaproteobacteria bacterium]|nr:dTMP kinase [Alphaproteobacteria bacterium]
MAEGFFITLEGGEGVGKTTQIQLLQEHLEKQGREVVTTREPGGTKAAEEIRELLASPEFGQEWSAKAELLLMNAARAMHVRDVIAPALKNSEIVISDRFIDSTRVYQGIVRGIDMDFIKELEKQIVGEHMPDFTLILDLPVEEAIKRVEDRGSDHHYDRAGAEFYQKLRDGFLQIAKMEPDRCAIIDASGNADEIANDIWTIVSSKI